MSPVNLAPLAPAREDQQEELNDSFELDIRVHVQKKQEHPLAVFTDVHNTECCPCEYSTSCYYTQTNCNCTGTCGTCVTATCGNDCVSDTYCTCAHRAC